MLIIIELFFKIQEETSMNNQDRAEADRLVAKNNVEEYIYDIRGKLCEELEEFMLEDDRNKYSLELEDAENWLYEDGEFAEKPEYKKKLSDLQMKGEAVKRRRYEHETRPDAINQFGQCLQLAQKVVNQYKVTIFLDFTIRFSVLRALSTYERYI